MRLETALNLFGVQANSDDMKPPVLKIHFMHMRTTKGQISCVFAEAGQPLYVCTNGDISIVFFFKYINLPDNSYKFHPLSPTYS